MAVVFRSLDELSIQFKLMSPRITSSLVLTDFIKSENCNKYAVGLTFGGLYVTIIVTENWFVKWTTSWSDSEIVEILTIECAYFLFT